MKDIEKNIKKVADNGSFKFKEEYWDATLVKLKKAERLLIVKRLFWIFGAVLFISVATYFTIDYFNKNNTNTSIASIENKNSIEPKTHLTYPKETEQKHIKEFNDSQNKVNPDVLTSDSEFVNFNNTNSSTSSNSSNSKELNNTNSSFTNNNSNKKYNKKTRNTKSINSRQNEMFQKPRFNSSTINEEKNQSKINSLTLENDNNNNSISNKQSIENNEIKISKANNNDSESVTSNRNSDEHNLVVSKKEEKDSLKENTNNIIANSIEDTSSKLSLLDSSINQNKVNVKKASFKSSLSLQAFVGGNFSQNFNDSKRIHGKIPYVGAELTYKFSQPLSVSLGAGFYTRNMESNQVSYTLNEYNFGLNQTIADFTLISSSWIEIPAKINYNAHKGHFLGLGASYSYLIKANNNISSNLAFSNEEVELKNDLETKYKNYQGFYNNTISGLVSYKYIYKKVGAEIKYNFGLNDMLNDIRMKSTKIDRNNRLSLTLTYSIF